MSSNRNVRMGSADPEVRTPSLDSAGSLAERIEALVLADHVAELDEVGLTVVPQTKLGLPDLFFASLRDTILEIAERRTGARLDLERGVTGGEFEDPTGAIGQFFVTHMIFEDPLFAKILVHPVKTALMEHMLGPHHRLSVSNAWIKWQTPDSWRGPVTTAMHADQGQVPSPWNPAAPHVANMNWLLTDYTKEDGAFAYAPGSHHEARMPRGDEAVKRAVAVEAPAGSLVMFQGGLWHGAFRKETPGLRISMHGLHCRSYYIPQQDFRGHAPNDIIEASGNPAYLRKLLREDDLWLDASIDNRFKVPRLKP